MIKIIESFLYPILHPFKVYDSYKNSIPIASNFGGELLKLNLQEALAMSWLVKIIRSIFQIIFLYYFTSAIFAMASSNSQIPEFIVSSGKAQGFLILVLGLIFEIIFFPLVNLFFITLWSFLIKTFAQLLGHDDPQRVADEIVVVSISSYFFEIIPFIGDFFQKIFQMVLLYAGLRKNLSASKSLSVLIILTPAILLFSFILVFVLGIQVLML